MKRLLPLLLAAAAPLPVPLPPSPPVPAPQDVAYPGTIKLDVVATDLDRHVFTVRETVPLAQSHDDVVLMLPKWIPGNHGPTGPIEALAGLEIRAGGKRIDWVRDPVEMYAFHVAPPKDATALDITFQFLSPPNTQEGRVVMTPDMLDLQWDAVILYPAGYYARRIPVSAALTVPPRWQIETALDREDQEGTTTRFATVPLDTLIDSPVFAGRYVSRLDLNPGGTPEVHMDVVADRPEELAVTDRELAVHRALVDQASRLFGAHHYRHYDFLLALSDRQSGIGLEHHESSEDGTVPNYFTEWDKTASGRDLLSHEYTHSWNGKFRRPADLYAADYTQPERDSLLWVYEGQTEYWGQVLAARSGLFSEQQALDSLAGLADQESRQVGRSWRNLQDTTNDPIFRQRRPEAWNTWQRSEDYYVEGLLIWLDADTLIREKTNGAKSLDDFARRFFGIEDGRVAEVTYTFDDVVAALNAVYPYDWRGFLRTRLDGHGPVPLDGITRGGYKLVYTDTPSALWKDNEARRKYSDFGPSIGLTVKGDGTVLGVQWDSAAFKAGLAQGLKIEAIDGIAWEGPDDLARAIKKAASPGTALALLVRDGRAYRTVAIEYHDGPKYPHLQRVDGTPARLQDILASKKQ